MTNGIDGLSKRLKDMERRAHELESTKSLPMEKLLTNKFMSSHTDFSNMDDFFSHPDINVKTTDDFRELDQSVLDDFVDKHSNFSDFQDMINSAASEYALNHLGF